MAGIFISYRREDSSGWSGRLAEAIRDAFGPENVFVDIATLEAGSDYARAIEQRLASADVLLAVIGPRWLTVSDRAGRRLDNPQDLVRREVGEALKRRIKVIPVLVGGAPMPSEADLPEDLRDLPRLQAHEMSDSRWDYDKGRLIELLGKASTVRPGLRRGRWARRRLYLGSILGAALVLGAGYLLKDVRFWPFLDEAGFRPRSAAELSLTSKLRPVPPGASVSSDAGSAATICCAVRDADGKLFMLTSEHAVVPGGPDSPVYQPGRADGGNESARIGRVSQIFAAEPGMVITAAGAPSKPAGPGIVTLAAGALIELAPGIGATMTAPGLGRIRGVAAPIVGERIRAVGRTSGLVEGSIISIDDSVPVRISPTESADLRGMIRTSPISEPGDSGAPVVNDRGELLGFVYAGSAYHSIVMPILPVLDALGVQLRD